MVDTEETLDLTLCTSTRTAADAPARTDGVRVRGRSGRDGLMIAAVDYNTPSTDTDEAVVIVNTGAADASLTGVFLASVNGSDGAVLKSFDLSSAGSLAQMGATEVWALVMTRTK